MKNHKQSLCVRLYHQDRFFLAGLFALFLALFRPRNPNTYYFALDNFRIFFTRIYCKFYHKKTPRPVLLCINRDCDNRRLSAFVKQILLSSFEFRRCKALDGYSEKPPFAEYIHLIGDTFSGGKNFPKGALAAFLSHIKCWTIFLETSKEICYVLEDDAKLVLPSLKGLPKLNYDIIFVNRRMSSFARYLGPPVAHISNFSPFLSFYDLSNLDLFFPIDSPGGDGYIISRRGAQSLLSFLSGFKIKFELDWFLFYFSLNTLARKLYCANDARLSFLDASEADSFRLSSLICSPWVADSFVGNTNSTISIKDPRNWVPRDSLF